MHATDENVSDGDNNMAKSVTGCCRYLLTYILWITASLLVSTVYKDDDSLKLGSSFPKKLYFALHALEGALF
jgi:hypothetical protein